MKLPIPMRRLSRVCAHIIRRSKTAMESYAWISTKTRPAARRKRAQRFAISVPPTVSMYPEQDTVRRELARFFGVRNDELLLTNGTDEALHLIVDTFLEPDDIVLLVEPTFAMYRFYSELVGARIQALRYGAPVAISDARATAAFAHDPPANLFSRQSE